MMNILISVNRSYFEQAKTMLHSLRRHNQEDITVYLLNRSLDPIAVNKFESYLRKHLRIHLEIIDISAQHLNSYRWSTQDSVLKFITAFWRSFYSLIAWIVSYGWTRIL